jgi:hypothetical protein
VQRSVVAATCAGCHEQQVAQFNAGKHALAWVAMRAMPTTGDQPAAIIEGLKGCGGCHRIGMDGGKCDSCHTRHRFAAAEARRPEACRTCHMGFDHPQWEMYSTSKHGSIYELEASHTNWEKKLSQLYQGSTAAGPNHARAPVCASCHMPDGDHGVLTAWGFLAVRLPEDDKEWLADRVTILRGSACSTTRATGPSGSRWSRPAGSRAVEGGVRRRPRQGARRLHEVPHEDLRRSRARQGDDVVRQTDRLMAAAIARSTAYRDGILARPADVPFSVDLLRFSENRHPIEQTLWTMFLEHRMRAFQGAFHMNPDYQHWHGWAEMKRDLVEIKAEAAQLRREHVPMK